MNNLVLLAKQAVEKYIEAENIIEPPEDFRKSFWKEKRELLCRSFDRHAELTQNKNAEPTQKKN